MYSTLCETVPLEEVAKVHSLLEDNGLHPLTIFHPAQTRNPGGGNEPFYTIKLEDKEIEMGRRVLMGTPYEMLTVR